MKCDVCSNEEDFVIYSKARREYVSCACGHEWEKGTSHSESTCPNCGNYQHRDAAREFNKGDKPCWFCFHKKKETHQEYLVRKKRNGNTS